MATAISYPHIVKENGEPARLERHPRLRVSMIVTHYLAFGRSPDEICLHLPHLTPAEVYSAMTYYFDHPQEIDAEIQAELDQLDDEARTKPRSPIWTKLKAKGLI
ncbi:MAG: DUF433 domain-containing protein [Gemmataceae bacterium]|nr:DUF433 domain-containing protein [Gemmataceae bacterium]MCI0737575.1 DUF433 domain-containing protein [Gemmataceae bacterium]